MKDREAVRYFTQRVDLISPPMVKRYWNDVADVHREGAVVPRYRIAHASRVAMRGMVLASAASKGPGRIPLFHHLLIGERKQRQHLTVGQRECVLEDLVPVCFGTVEPRIRTDLSGMYLFLSRSEQGIKGT